PVGRALQPAIAAAIVASVLTVAAGGQSAIPTGPALATGISDHLDRALADKATDADREWVRNVFRTSGVPTVRDVGAVASEDYVLLCVHDQPLAFVEKVAVFVSHLPLYAVPINARVFLNAQLRQKRVEAGVHEPVPLPEVRDRIHALFVEDQ